MTVPGADKNLELSAKKLGYVCIFLNTTDEAVATLHRLITTVNCGFDEGIKFWREAVDGILAGHLSSLNWAGARFSEPEWRVILETVRDRL